jgi:hypothetical protein
MTTSRVLIFREGLFGSRGTLVGGLLPEQLQQGHLDRFSPAAALHALGVRAIREMR